MERLEIGCQESSHEGDWEKFARLNGRVLIVDDAPDILKLTARILCRLGLEVTTAENGRDAFEIALLAKEAGSGFDVILMDVELPIISGMEATALLRESGFSEPIIAIPGSAGNWIEQHCLDAGCSDFISKPVTFERLYDSLRRYLKVAVATM